MSVNYEKMLFFNDLAKYQTSIEGKQLKNAFNDFDNNKISLQELEKYIDNYYYCRNYTELHYDNLEELENAKNLDQYIGRLYQELN